MATAGRPTDAQGESGPPPRTLLSRMADVPAAIQVLASRRTVRFYRAEPVPDALVRAVLEAAHMAPSAQPARFVVITTPDVKRRLAEGMAARWRRDLERSGVQEAAIRVQLRFSVRRFSEAPVLILAGYTMEDMDRYPDRARQAAEVTMAVQSTAAAIENLLLAASAYGLGACWCCAPLFCPGIVRRTLGLPRSFVPQALLTVGYPAHVPPAPPRRPLEQVVTYL